MVGIISVPSPLHHTFLLGRANFTAQPLGVFSERPEARYVGENTTMVTLTSYFIQPCPCQFPLNCKRIRTKYNKKHLRSLTDAVIIRILPQNFNNSVRA